MQELKDAFVALEEDGDEEPLREVILPYERLLDHLPKVYVKDSAVDAVCHGADLAVPGITKIEGNFDKGRVVAVMTQKGEAIAIGEARMPAGNILESKFFSAKSILEKRRRYQVLRQRLSRRKLLKEIRKSKGREKDKRDKYITLTGS